MGELVDFAAPFAAHCTDCELVLPAGTRVAGASKARERDSDGALHFVYGFGCAKCSAQCAFVRRAGELTYTLRGSLRGTKSRTKCSDQALLAAGRAARTLDEQTAKTRRDEAELALLQADRDAKYEDDVGACAAAAAQLSGKRETVRPRRRIRKKRSSEATRARVRSMRAALGDEGAAVVRRATRVLRKRGVNLASILAANRVP